MRDLYQILGVSRDAGEREIKSAFRRLARIYHPDVNASPEAAEQFKQLAEAYRILINPRLRESYCKSYSGNYSEYVRRMEIRRAVSRRIDAAVEEMLSKDREEERARKVAVRTVVSLFLSTFGVALTRPPIFESLDSVGWLVVLLLFLLGVREIAINVGLSLERFTYVDQMIVNLLNAPAPPTQPFSRSAAVGFLVVGYFSCMGVGLFLGEWSGHPIPVFRGGGAYLGILLLPPIAVLIINRLGGLSERR